MNRDLYSELFAEIARLDDQVNDRSLGRTTPITEEPIRFDIETSLAFPETTMRRHARQEESRLSTVIFGLFGPIGALPHVYTEELAIADREHSEAMREFFNILNHRSLSLMYRAWRKNRVWLEHSPGDPSEQREKITSMLGGFCSVAVLPPRIAWLDMHRSHVLSVADTMQRRVRNANGLQLLLRRRFRMDFYVEQFVGTWEPLPDEVRSCFGHSINPMKLGYNTVIGSRTWQVQSTFRVVIPHPNADQYLQLQPGSDTVRRLQLMIQMYCTPELSFRLLIVVRGDVIQVGSMGRSEQGGMMVGWNTVMGTPDPDRDYHLYICKNYNESRMTT